MSDPVERVIGWSKRHFMGHPEAQGASDKALSHYRKVLAELAEAKQEAEDNYEQGIKRGRLELGAKNERLRRRV